MTWEEIDADGGRAVLSHGQVDDDGIVTTPAATLLAQAQSAVGRITLEEYALARVIHSEAGGGPPAELLAIGDADLNRAAREGRSILDHVTAGSGIFGKQGSATSSGRKRPVATTRDPSVRDYRAARLLLSPTSGARGITRGALAYLSPRTQLAMWAKGSSSYMHPKDVVTKWTFGLRVTADRMVDGRRQVTLSAPDQKLTENDREPVFPCGVDPWEQMFFRPTASADSQARRHDAAQALIASAGTKKPPCDGDDEALAAWLAAAAAVAIVVATKKDKDN